MPHWYRRINNCHFRSGLTKNRLLELKLIANERPFLDIQIKVANGRLETPSATVELQLDVGGIFFKERFIVMTNLTRPLTGFLLGRNNNFLDLRQAELNSFVFFMQLNHAHNTYSNTNEPLLNTTDILIEPSKQTVIYIKS